MSNVDKKTYIFFIIALIEYIYYQDKYDNEENKLKINLSLYAILIAGYAIYYVLPVCNFPADVEIIIQLLTIIIVFVPSEKYLD